MLKTKRVKAGSWETLEWFWNTGGVAYFRAPRGATIKVRYGVGFVGKDRQKQTLNGSDIKKLKVDKYYYSLTRARMQIKVQQTTDVQYFVKPAGDTSELTPELPF